VSGDMNFDLSLIDKVGSASKAAAPARNSKFVPRARARSQQVICADSPLLFDNHAFVNHSTIREEDAAPTSLTL
jgi:hypothetical protein